MEIWMLTRMINDRGFHQENLSAIIVGCGLYNWTANCDAVVTTAI
jgi:hypothetical protein